MMKRFFILFICLGATINLFAQNETNIDFNKIDNYYSKMVKDWDLPGASIGIVKNGKLVFVGNYGVMEMGKQKAPDENSLYAIASNSKAFTSAIIGMLVQEGKLSWNDKVVEYLPDFSLFNDPWLSNEVTIRDILSHRVGLGTFSGDVIWYKSDLKTEDFYKLVKNLPKAHDFRAGYGYSNHMYLVAGEIIKKVTGKSWGENVSERILKPLEMKRTIYTAKNLKEKGNYATPHGRENETNFPIEWEDWEQVAAMGGLISSVNDVAKWMIFMMNYGVVNNDTLLSKNTVNTVWTPHNNFMVDHTSENPLGRHFSGYGLGWSVGDYYGNFMVGHTGGFDGMISAVTLLPDQKLGVVVLTNGQKSPIMAATYFALDQFVDSNPRDWSAQYLERYNNYQIRDTRVDDIKKNKVEGTKPSLQLADYAGVYKSDIYGEINVVIEKNQLKINFEHSPRLSATLKHWHYDVWEIIWDHKHSWFNFGTVNFLTNNIMEVTGMEIVVPNDDIFFEELKPYKIK
jgi:CubicO group peptidase (beta-lactamase class C family)